MSGQEIFILIDEHRDFDPVHNRLASYQGLNIIFIETLLSQINAAEKPSKYSSPIISFMSGFWNPYPGYIQKHSIHYELLIDNLIKKKTPVIGGMIDQFNRIFENQCFNLMIFRNVSSPWTPLFILLGRQMGIPTLLLAQEDAGLLPWPRRVLTDKMIVFGESARKAFLHAGNRKDRIVTTGNPKWDNWQLCPESKRGRLRQEMAVDKHARIIVFAPTLNNDSNTSTDPLGLGIEDLQSVLSAIKMLGRQDVQLWIKLRPGQADKRTIYETALSGQNIPFRILVDEESKLILQVAHVLIGYGDITVEAMLLDTPVIFIHYPACFPFVTVDFPFFICTLVEEICDALNQVFNGEKSHTQSAMTAFLYEVNGPCDGNATQRVVDFVLEMAMGKKDHAVIDRFDSPVAHKKKTTYYTAERPDLLEMITTPPENVLEIGCGQGNFGEKVISRFPCRYVGVEFDLTAAEAASGRLDQVIHGDVEQLDLEKQGIAQSSIDLIIYGDVLEHLRDPWRVLADHSRLLKSGGSVLISIPNIRNIEIIKDLMDGNWQYTEQGILDADHLRFFTLKEVRQWLTRSGFTIETIKQLTPTGVKFDHIEGPIDIQLPRITLKGLTREEVMELYTVQFLIKAVWHGEGSGCGLSTSLDACPLDGEKYKVQLSGQKLSIPNDPGEDRHRFRGENAFTKNQNTGQSNKRASIIIVTFNSEALIGPCIESVIVTLTETDEIIVVDNSSTDGTVAVVQACQKNWRWIRLVENHHNLGYSAAVNVGIRVAANPLLVFLNPDTLVTAHWLERLAAHFQSDRIGAVGPVSNYVAGAQKVVHYLSQDMGPFDNLDDFAQRLYLKNKGRRIDSRLLVGFCIMVRKSVLETVGLLDEDLFLGNDDLDLSLRLRQVGYKLKIATDTFIYHKGQASFNTVPSSLTQRLVQESTDALYLKLIQKFGLNHVPDSQELWGMDWFKPASRFKTVAPLTSIIVLTLNQLDYTRQCVTSLMRYTGAPFELIFVDNGSTDGTQKYLRNIDRTGTACIRIHLIENTKNTGFAGGNNQGIAFARGANILFLNNDVVVSDQWLSKLLAAMERGSSIGLVGPVSNQVAGPQRVTQIDYDPDTLDTFDTFTKQWALANQNQLKTCWRLVGFCLLARREVIETIGGFDIRAGSGNFEDDDFCIRANLAGFRGVIAQDCFIHHYGGRTFKGQGIHYNNQFNGNWQWFRDKWQIPGELTPEGIYTLPKPHGGFDPARHFIAVKNMVT